MGRGKSGLPSGGGSIARFGASSSSTLALSAGTLKSIDDYIEGTGNSFTVNEINEIKANMTETSNSLYRVEDMSWMGEDLEIGDEFTFDKPLKGFTQDWDGISTVISEGDDAGLYEDTTVALFQTVNKTSHLDVSKMSRNHSDEKESLVGGKFRVLDQYDGPKIKGYDTWIFLIEQVEK